MANQTVWQQLRCGLSVIEHICESPAVCLSCNHCVCEKCLAEFGINQKNFKCKICDFLNTNDLKSSHRRLSWYEKLLNENLENIFHVLYDHFKKSFTKCKHFIETSNETIDLKIDFIKDEIEIKVESLKMELDKLHETMNNELDDMRMRWKTELNDTFNEQINISKLEIQITELESKINKNAELTNDTFFLYQNKFKEFESSFNELMQYIPSVKFDSPMSIDRSIIGSLVYHSEQEMHKRIVNQLKENIYQETTVGFIETRAELCALSNNNLLLSFIGTYSGLSLFDSNLKLLRTTLSINNKSIRIFGIAVNDESNNEVYLTDMNHHRVIKTDFEFNQLAEFGSRGSNMDQFDWPMGICFFNGSIFVCDLRNKRAQKLSSSNLSMEASYPLDHAPVNIKNIKNVACLTLKVSVDKHLICFYNLNDFTLIRKYEEHDGGMVTVTRQHFYEYSRSKKLFYCYNIKGDLIEQVKTDNLLTTNRQNWTAMCVFNSKLLMAKCFSSTIILI